MAFDHQPLLTYGLRDKKLHHISEVANGLKCNCTCPGCGHILIARNNPTNKKIAHFAHYKGMECNNAIESAIHLLAKEILEEKKKLRLPNYHYDYDNTNPDTLFRELNTLIFDRVILEERISVGSEFIIPDAICFKSDIPVYVEFANTHFVEEKKRELLFELGISCIELDLRDLPLGRNEIENFFYSTSPRIYWLINPKLDLEYKIATAKSLEEERIEEAKRKQIAEEKKRKREQKKIRDKAEYQQLIETRKYRLIEKQKDKAIPCPKRDVLIDELRNSKFYENALLKKIIDGEYWNRKIYRNRWRSNIFVNGEDITLYDGANEPSVKKQWDQAYAGLKTIQDEEEDRCIGNCKDCPERVKYLDVDDKVFIVCGFTNDMKHLNSKNTPQE